MLGAYATQSTVYQERQLFVSRFILNELFSGAVPQEVVKHIGQPHLDHAM